MSFVSTTGEWLKLNFGSCAVRKTRSLGEQIMAPCTHPGMKRLFCLKAKNGLDRFGPSTFEFLPHLKHPRLKKHLFSSRNPMYLIAATINTKGGISGMPSMQPTEQICTSPPGLRVSEHMPRRPSCVCVPKRSVSRAIATGALEA